MSIQDRRLRAAKKGSRFFDSGKACNLGHGTVRYVSSNQCVECTKARATAAQEAFRQVRTYCAKP